MDEVFKIVIVAAISWIAGTIFYDLTHPRRK